MSRYCPPGSSMRGRATSRLPRGEAARGHENPLSSTTRSWSEPSMRAGDSRGRGYRCSMRVAARSARESPMRFDGPIHLALIGRPVMPTMSGLYSRDAARSGSYEVSVSRPCQTERTLERQALSAARRSSNIKVKAFTLRPTCCSGVRELLDR